MQQSLIRVAVVGAGGRMGREVLAALTPKEGFDIVLAVDRAHAGSHAREVAGLGAPDIEIEGKLGAGLDRTGADVLVDFSHHSAACSHAQSALKRGVSPVIGVTGLSDETVREIHHYTQEHGRPAMYVPNFAIGACLMIRFAQIAARWLPDAEIIEMHHDAKEDAPSGTAMLTAERIAEGRTRAPKRLPRPLLKVEGARGARWNETTIHSVRLPGLLAHQQVMFGGPGEVLTLRHDSLDRASFMEGVKLCAREVRGLSGLVIGMDSLLFRE